MPGFVFCCKAFLSADLPCLCSAARHSSQLISHACSTLHTTPFHFQYIAIHILTLATKNPKKPWAVLHDHMQAKMPRSTGALPSGVVPYMFGVHHSAQDAMTLVLASFYMLSPAGKECRLSRRDERGLLP